MFGQCDTQKSMGQVASSKTKMLKEEENTKTQKERRQENLLADLAFSAKEQIQNQVEKDLKPKLDELLAKKSTESSAKN